MHASPTPPFSTPCGCGTPDPDCQRRAQADAGCGPSRICDSSGRCADVPDAWSCEPARYGDGWSCDCRCGVPDPDCVGLGRSPACGDDERCGRDGECIGIPSEWRCYPWAFGDGICDCQCGVEDSDCQAAARPARDCPPETYCAQPGLCSPVPDEWHCPARSFATGDGCHCGCGARDPDCDVPRAFVIGCSADEACDAEGRCRSRWTAGGGGACRMAPGGSSAGGVIGAVTVVLLAATRRRRS